MSLAGLSPERVVMLKVRVGKFMLGFVVDDANGIFGLKERAAKLGHACKDPEVKQAYRDIWTALSSVLDQIYLGESETGVRFEFVGRPVGPAYGL